MTTCILQFKQPTGKHKHTHTHSQQVFGKSAKKIAFSYAKKNKKKAGKKKLKHTQKGSKRLLRNKLERFVLDRRLSREG